MSTFSLAITVVTFRRELGIKRLLASLERAFSRMPANPYEVTVHVVDNDPDSYLDGDSLEGSYELPVTYHRAGLQDIASGRNFCVQLAKPGQHLLFLDDDQSVGENFFLEVTDFARLVGDRIAAYMVPCQWRFDRDVPEISLIRRRYTDRKLKFLERIEKCTRFSTNGLMVTPPAIRDGAIHFRKEFGESGGEDTDLYLRLAKDGWHVFAVDRPTVYEHVPLDRQKPWYIARRTLHMGQMNARWSLYEVKHNIAKRRHPSLRNLAFWGPWGLIKTGPLYFIDRARAHRRCLQSIFKIGLVLGYFGITSNFYSNWRKRRFFIFAVTR